MVIKPLVDKKTKRTSSLFQSVIIAAAFTGVLTSLWIGMYLLTTFVGPGIVLLDVVLGNSPDSLSQFNSMDVLFIIVSRLIVGFGILWLPSSLIIWMVQRNFS